MSDDIFSVALQGASIITQMDARDSTYQPVGNPGGKDAGEERILSFPPPAADDVISLLQFLQDSRDVGRIVLKIGVKGNYDPTSRIFEASRNRSRLSKIPNKLEEEDLLVSCRDFF